MRQRRTPEFVITQLLLIESGHTYLMPESSTWFVIRLNGWKRPTLNIAVPQVGKSFHR